MIGKPFLSKQMSRQRMKFSNGIPFSYLFFLTWLLFFIAGTKSKTEKRSTYTVHMNKFFMPKLFTDHRNWYSSLLDSTRFSEKFSFDEPQSMPSIIYSHDNAIHGFSASLSLRELEVLKKSRGYVSSYSEQVIQLQTTHTPDQWLSLNHVSGLWPTSKYGKDIIIGVIDSGIWPEHPSFKDDGITKIDPSKWKRVCEEGQEFNSSMCNSKIIGARYFKDGVLSDNEGLKISMDSARDTVGHGTIISSIAAGNFVDEASYFGYAAGTAKGVAPKARLGIYKVTTDDKSAYPNDILAGMDQAIADGVDVISISLGAKGHPLFVDPIAKASFSAMEKGIVVTCAGGNGGPGLGTIYNGFPWVITVTSGSVDRWFAGILILGDVLKIVGWSTFPGPRELPTVPLVYQKTISSCDNSELLSQASHGIILCDPGNVTNQLSTLTSSDILGAIVIKEDYIAQRMTCPCIVIGLREAKQVFEYIKSNKSMSASIHFQQTITDIDIRPYVLHSSSRGPSQSYSYILKPDVIAPGQLILGASIPKQSITYLSKGLALHSNYNLMSGSSYACPHVSGLAALLKSAHPNWSPAAIRSAIMTTANPFDNTRDPIRDSADDFKFASPLAMGAGHINPNKALDPGLIYDVARQDYVNLLCSMNFTSDELYVTTKSRNLDCSRPSTDLNYPSFIILYKDYEILRIQKFRRIVTNVGMDTTTYKAIVEAPEGSEVIVSPKRLVFQRTSNKLRYTLAIKYRGNKEQKVSFGALSWVEENGTHIVRSPIVVSPVVNTTIAGKIPIELRTQKP